MKENQIRELVNELRDIAIEYHGTQQLRERIARTVRAALHHDLEKLNQPVSQTYELPELIEGMEVSIDVSTCDADAGNRYFGTVTEVSELDTAKNGYILLVQDAEPNFDVNGNSPVIPEDLHRAAMLQDNQRDLSQPVDPQVADYEKTMLQAGWVMVPKTVTPEISLAINKVGQHCTCGNCSQRLWDMLLAAAPQPQNAQQNITENIHAGKSTATPDCWISCSERMPAQDDWVLIYSKYGEYLAGQVQGKYVELNDGTLSWLGAALHWMPLPEPPQQ